MKNLEIGMLMPIMDIPAEVSALNRKNKSLKIAIWTISVILLIGGLAYYRNCKIIANYKKAMNIKSK